MTETDTETRAGQILKDLPQNKNQQTLIGMSMLLLGLRSIERHLERAARSKQTPVQELTTRHMLQQLQAMIDSHERSLFQQLDGRDSDVDDVATLIDLIFPDQPEAPNRRDT